MEQCWGVNLGCVTTPSEPGARRAVNICWQRHLARRRGAGLPPTAFIAAAAACCTLLRQPDRLHALEPPIGRPRWHCDGLTVVVQGAALADRGAVTAGPPCQAAGGCLGSTRAQSLCRTPHLRQAVDGQDSSNEVVRSRTACDWLQLKQWTPCACALGRAAAARHMRFACNRPQQTWEGQAEVSGLRRAIGVARGRGPAACRAPSDLLGGRASSCR